MATFGLQIPNFTFDGPPGELFDRVADLAEAAEDTGYKSVWVMDHFFQLPALGGPDQPMLEAYTLLGALAACTDAVELGALVTGVTYRNPAILAKQVTTLDIISKGRAVLGLGAAWYDVEHHALGVEYPPDGVRLDMLEEALQICRAMFTKERSSFDGRHFSTRDARNIPAPLRPGGPRILVGGGGEKRTLRLVAKYADACNVNAGGATLRRKIDVLREHCADVGRDPAEVRVTRLVTVLPTTSASETADARKFLVDLAGADFAEACIVGEPGDLVDQFGESIELGVEEHLINAVLSGPDAVRHLGELLTTSFSHA